MNNNTITQYAVFGVLLLIGIVVLYFLLFPMLSKEDSPLSGIVTDPQDIKHYPVNFRPITEGYFSGYEPPTTFVFYERQEWLDHWNYVYGSIENEPDLPYIDFNKQYVIAIYAGINEVPPADKHSFHTVEVKDVVDTNIGKRQFYITYTFLARSCPSAKNTKLYKPFTMIVADLPESDGDMPKHEYIYDNRQEKCKK